MGEKKNPKKASEILQAVHEFVLGPEEDITAIPSEEVQASLKAEGMDPTPLIRHVRERLTKLRAQDDLMRAHNQRQQLLDRLQQYREMLARAPSRVKEHILERLNQLSLIQPSMAQAYFRKFEETSEADMGSLLEDLMMLDEMGKEHAEGAES